jgi:hypothetical protein
VPTFLTALTVSLAILAFMDSPGHRHGTYRAPNAGILGTLLYSLLMMVLSLPSAIITYRFVVWLNSDTLIYARCSVQSPPLTSYPTLI